MRFQQRWQRLPQWLQVTVYTVLGLGAMGGVAWLAIRLINRLFNGGEGLSGVWYIIGVAVVLSAVFGGLGRNRRRREKHRNSHTHQE